MNNAMRTIVGHEIVASIYDLQLIMILMVIFLSIVLSLGFGAVKQIEMIRQYENAQRATISALEVQKQYSANNIYFNRRVPDLYFCSRGYNNFLPLTVLMPDQNTRMLPQYITSDVENNVVFAVFDTLDFTAVAGMVLSLAAMLFGHAAICGEKENGTLKMLLTGRVTRFQIAIAKYIGGLLPILISYLLAVLCAGIAVEFIAGNVVIGNLADFLAAMGLGAAVMVTFYSISFAVSTMVHSSKLSLLICILIWLTSVYIAPSLIAESVRTSASAESALDLVREVSEIQKRTYFQEMQAAAELMNRYTQKEGLSMGQAAMRAYPEAADRFRQVTRDRVQAVFDSAARRTDEQMHWLRLFSLFVPSVSFITATNELCDTGFGYYRVFRAAVNDYADATVAFIVTRMTEDPIKRRLNIRQREDDTGKIVSEVQDENYGYKLDFGGMPTFPAIATDSNVKITAILYAIASDCLWIVVSLLVIANRMRRFDVR